MGWELAYNNDNLWHFRFHGPTPEALVKGREKTYFAYFWNDLAADKKRSLSMADRKAYVASYSRPGRMRAGWAYFAAWPDTANDFAGDVITPGPTGMRYPCSQPWRQGTRSDFAGNPAVPGNKKVSHSQVSKSLAGKNEYFDFPIRG
jgi:hypothetical protein